MTSSHLDARRVYEHRQVGWPILGSAVLPFVLLAAWSAMPHPDRTLPARLAEWSWAIPSSDSRLGPALLPMVGGVVFLCLCFSWLTVVITSTQLRCRFGIGLFRRTIPLARIRRARVVRTRWYEGWGIHWTRNGMLYNVAGFDAVAVDLDDGRTLRIGSDDAERLQRAIERAVDAACRPPTAPR